jgi:hypothetical protein
VDTYAYIGEVICGFVYLFVGVRLYLLSRHTGHVPEGLIAASFLLWMLSYALWDIPFAFVDSEEAIPAVFSYGSQIALVSGNVVLAFFIRAVFQPDARWAKWLVAAVAVSSLAGLTGMASMGDWAGRNPLANPWYWLEFFGSVALTAWMGAEGLAQYFKTRKQLKLGLCEPMVCNRFLLWGIAGSHWFILEPIVAVSDLIRALTGDWSELLGIGIALFEILPVAIVWFVFFPPAFYCRWVERGGKSTDAVPPPAD